MIKEIQNTDQLLHQIADLLEKPKEDVLKYVYLIPSDKGTKVSFGYKAMAELAKKSTEHKK